MKKNLTDETKLHVSFGPWNQENVAGAVVLYENEETVRTDRQRNNIEKAPLTS